MVMQMAPILLVALLIDGLFGRWRPGWLREARFDRIRQAMLAAVTQSVPSPGMARAFSVAALGVGVVAALSLDLLVTMALPVPALWSIALAALAIGMKRLSFEGHAVADGLRETPEAALDSVRRFTGDGNATPSPDEITALTTGALADRMARDVLTPALALLVLGLPGLLVSLAIRLLRDPALDGPNDAAWAATRLDALFTWPARWITCALLARLEPDPGDASQPIHIEARMEALWKLWLGLLALAAILSFL